MVTLLQQAFAEAAKLPQAEQELLAARLLAELAAEDDFDRAIAGSSDKLAALAQDALSEHRSVQIPTQAIVDKPRAARQREIMDYTKLITIEPDKRSGQPCIRGLRMTVQDVLEYLVSGMSAEEILADFPDLTAEDISACLAFAADRERRQRVVRPA
jgi:uncharacterized protein (DUF433 family)